jgi:serine/threonine protein kinase
MLVGIPPFYNDNLKLLYQNIEKGNLKLPKYLSAEAKKFLSKILSKDPRKRPTLDQIKKDPFFADLDWSKLAKRDLVPPTVL